MIDLSELFPRAMGRPITVQKAWASLLLDSDAPNFSDRYQNYWNLALQGQSVGKLQSVKKLNLFGVSPTLAKSEGYGGVYHPFECRPIHTAERKRLGSYPDRFLLTGWKSAVERIGNSVPPLMMFAIATQIRHKLWGGVELKPMKKGIAYPAHLEMMWQKHLADREPDAPTVISTFAGGGGSSLGYSMAGFRELLAVEWDNNAVETFKLNFPDVSVYHGDIARLSVDECLQLAGIQPGELDIFDGSPPCQGFSTAGKRILNDPRNQLFKEYVRLLRGLQPKVFVMENVSGMVKGKMKLVFVEILKELKASGYKVSARLLNAMYFHVPQSRQRMIFIGVRDDLGIEPSHPKAESRVIAVKTALVGANDFLPHIPDYNTKLGQCCQKLKQGQNGETLFGKNWGFQLIRLKQNKPAPTISKGGGATGFIHPTRDTKVSMGELKRLASFADEYRFLGKRNTVQDRIGNSVPPLFMEAIARHIRQNILDKVADHTGKTPGLAD